MTFSISAKDRTRILTTLGKANKAFQQIYPGDKPDRQPVHTVYGGADLFKADTAQKMANAALKTFTENATDFTEFARAIELPGHDKLPKKLADQMKVGKRLDKLAASKDQQHLYKADPNWLAHATYNKVIETLKGAGLVKEELHILKWVGPQPEKQVATPGNDQSFRTREDAEFWIKQERRTGNFRSIVGPVVDKDGWWHVAVERRVA